MTPNVDIFVTTVLHEGFAQTLVDSYKRNTKVPATLRWLVDSQAPSLGTVQAPVFQDYELIYSKGSGCNQLWNEAVLLSLENKADICVVLNDDVYLLPTWLEAIVQVFARNPQVGLVGIPCDDSAFKPRLGADRTKWFTDLKVFQEDQFERFLERPAKYEPWVSGFCWACRPEPWLAAGGVGSDIYWSYGEMDMGLNMWDAGWHVVSIYYPQVYHYGGGAFAEPTAAWVGAHCGQDFPNFVSRRGTGECHELHRDWLATLKERRLPDLQYQPQVADFSNA